MSCLLYTSMHDAIIEANYWNAENVMYQATDSRTISALGAYYSAYGRCGEESAFGVNVYRAIGIPARQIYTPVSYTHLDVYKRQALWFSALPHVEAAIRQQSLPQPRPQEKQQLQMQPQ